MNHVETILQKAQDLNGLRSSTMERLSQLEGTDGQKLDFEIVTLGLQQSLGEIDTRLLGIIELIAGFENIENTSLVPSTYMNELKGAIDQVSSNYDTIKTQLDNIESAGGGIGTIDPEHWIIQSKNGQASLNLSKLFAQVNSNVDSLLQNYYLVAQIVKGEGYSDFSSALSEFTKQLNQLKKARSESEKILTLVSEAYKEIETQKKKGEEIKGELDRLQNEGEKARKSLQEYESQGTSDVTSIQKTQEEAEKLKALVDNYQPIFERFQKELDDREKSFESGEKTKEELFTDLKNIKKKITELNDQAEGMLSGATIAGLAGSFGKLREKFDEELKKAKNAFYFAMVLLVVSVLPLLFFVLSGSQIHYVTTDNSTLELFGQIVMRALLLLPAAWFAKFAAGRHAALFRLREHYAYKYSLASSVEGFKKQAEPFKDAIAAATFFELTFNPADKMDSKAKVSEERHPNQVMEWIMKKLGTTYDGKSQ